MPHKLGICSQILRPMQKYKNICWFLAIIVIMFYSQRSRKVIMESSKTWDIRGKTGVERTVFSLFKKLLYMHYLIVGDDPAKSSEYKTFNEDTFVEILNQLYEMNSNDFPYYPDDNEEGHQMDSYIYKLYNLFGVDCKMFDMYSNDLYYSTINKEFDNINIDSEKPAFIHHLNHTYEDDGHAPSILIIATDPLFTPYINNKIVKDDVKRELTSMKEELTYNSASYILDSVYLVNANMTGFDHAIVGMTCKKKKFIFNGQPVNYKRNFPCVLMRHDWNILQDRDFYLSNNDCELHYEPETENENCYNFSEGNRNFIYVRKNASRDTSQSKESDVEKYRQIQRNIAISDKRRDTARLEEQLYEDAIPKKPNTSRFARLLTPLSSLISSMFPIKIATARLDEEIKEARLLYEEQNKVKKVEEQQKKNINN